MLWLNEFMYITILISYLNLMRTHHGHFACYVLPFDKYTRWLKGETSQIEVWTSSTYKQSLQLPVHFRKHLNLPAKKIQFNARNGGLGDKNRNWWDGDGNELETSNLSYEPD